MNNKEIGKRIKLRRLELNLTLKEVADLVGVASSTIQRYESGYITQYKMPVLQSIANALNVNPTWFVREEAPKEISSQNKVINKQKDFNITDKEKELLTKYNKLNETGKSEALKRITELTEISRYLINDEIVATKDNYLMPVAAHDDELTDDEKDFMQKCIEKYEKNK